MLRFGAVIRLLLVLLLDLLFSMPPVVLAVFFIFFVLGRGREIFTLIGDTPLEVGESTDVFLTHACSRCLFRSSSSRLVFTFCRFLGDVCSTALSAPMFRTTRLVAVGVSWFWPSSAATVSIVEKDGGCGMSGVP